MSLLDTIDLFGTVVCYEHHQLQHPLYNDEVKHNPPRRLFHAEFNQNNVLSGLISNVMQSVSHLCKIDEHISCTSGKYHEMYGHLHGMYSDFWSPTPSTCTLRHIKFASCIVTVIQSPATQDFFQQSCASGVAKHANHTRFCGICTQQSRNLEKNPTPSFPATAR